jgi:hypothetical protein
VKNIISIILCISASINIFAQNESAKWYFGENAALDFMTNPPTVINNSAMHAYDGCSSMADVSGNLLFYTDGIKVWNKQHVIMPNGILAFAGSPNNAYPLIIKQPGNSSLYYIFRALPAPHVTNWPVPPITSGLYYSVVDMSLASGMGSVTVNNMLVYTAPFYLSTTGQLHATKHANGVDFWIMIHDYPNNNFRAYLLSSTGLNPAAVVSSSTGLSYQGGSEGYLKFSPTGQKLCISVSYAGIELYDFNTNSGLVSNPITLLSNGLEQNYLGCEFSSDGTKLYAGHSISGSTNSKLIQWDLSAGTASAILSSSVHILSPALVPASMQLAPNGKIYIATFGSQSLSVINNPNATGNNCNLAVGGQPIAAAINSTLNSYSRSGLPNMISYATNTPCVTQTVNNPQSICAGNFYAISHHSYSTAGTYLDTLQNVFACNDIVIVNTQLVVNAVPNVTVSSASSICINDSITITASGANTYTWNSISTGSQFTTPTFTTTGSFIYTVQLQGTGNAGCLSTKTVTVNILVQSCDVGIKQKDLQWFSDNITLFPNPTSGNLNIFFSGSVPADIRTFSVFNNLGQLIKKENIELHRTPVDIGTSDLSPGLYQIRFDTRFGAVTKKFVKSRD